MPPAQLQGVDAERRELIDTVLRASRRLRASRVLVAAAFRSFDAWDGEEATLPQYRILAVLCSRGPQPVAGRAGTLVVTPPNATRRCDRRAQNHLVGRPPVTDRRAVPVTSAASGRHPVDRVGTARRDEVGRLSDHVPVDGRTMLTAAPSAFGWAGGEGPDEEWALEWGQAGEGAARRETGGSER